MGSRSLDKPLESLEAKVAALPAHSAAIDRWRSDVAAALFHLRRNRQGPITVCILGGTGTGKSTLVNRLLGANLTSANFRRTFTAGPVAVAAKAADVPEAWLGLPRTVAASGELPVRGQTDSLIVIEAQHELLGHVVLVDTPDLDGDQPLHHAQADRAFRWAEALIFLVSPEKYQMTELLPYYRLARRYAVPALFVMNKCESPEMLEDYRRLVSADQKDACVFAVARDDAAYEPAEQSNLSSLARAISSLRPPDDAAHEGGMAVRIGDVLGRLRDQITGPLRVQRRDVDVAVASLRAMETPAPGVDVNPITEQLQRRLQQRSVLYLIGPGRILDRVRQMPGILVRLPRTAWDMVINGRMNIKAPAEQPAGDRQVPDFNATLADQFAIIQSRIDDAIRGVSAGPAWLSDPAHPYEQSKIDPSQAGKIADEELKDLNDWLQKRWNATPRDTVLLLKLLRHLPGGEKLTQWTEAAPYLLAIIVAAHHAIFGHVDLMILGGYSLATWLTEKLSNEVSARTRQANRAIALRFERLARQQIRQSIAWIESRAPRLSEIDAIESMANELQELL
jgi:RNase P/RNase MRP subunit POP5